MEMFNVHRRDVMNFDNYMDLKKPGFGGPSSAVAFKDKSGKRVVDNPKLQEFQRVVERDPMFASKHYDSTYKAMTHDVIYKQEKKKPVKYRDPYLTALPVVDISKVEESFACTSFRKFVNEQDENDFELPELDFEDEKMLPGDHDDSEYEVRGEDFEEMEEPIEQDDEFEMDEPDEKDDFYDEDKPPMESEPTSKDIDDIERMLKSFETGGSDEEYED
jgi:hypothetical protein